MNANSQFARKALTALMMSTFTLMGAPAFAQLIPVPKAIAGTVLDPTKPHKIIAGSIRAGTREESSRFGVDENVYRHYRISDDGWVYQSDHASGAQENWVATHQKAEVRHNPDGSAYYYFNRAENSPRAPQHDRQAQPARLGPQRVVAYRKQPNNNPPFVYEQFGGTSPHLTVSRAGNLLHDTRYVGESWRGNQKYFRYVATYGSNTAPAWVQDAVRQGRFEIWFPENGNGVVSFSTNNGQSFVSEQNFSLAGNVTTQPY